MRAALLGPSPARSPEAVVGSTFDVGRAQASGTPAPAGAAEEDGSHTAANQPGEQPHTACRTRSVRVTASRTAAATQSLAYVMRFNAGRPEGAKRLKDVAVALGLAAPADPVEAANTAADKVSELLVATGHAGEAAEVKVPKDDLEEDAESAFLDHLYNVRAVSFPAEITELYQDAY